MATMDDPDASQTGMPECHQLPVTEQQKQPNQALTAGQPGLYPQFILFGDSITQRATLTLQPRLQDWYNRQADVVNRGFSGYTASLAASILPYFLPLTTPAPSSTQPKIRLVTVWFGANDAALPGNPQHVPLETYTADIRRIIEYPVFRCHDTKLILITPAPVDEWQLTKPLNRTVNSSRRYARAVVELAEQMQVPCIDLWTMFMNLATTATATATVSATTANEHEHYSNGKIETPPATPAATLLNTDLNPVPAPAPAHPEPESPALPGTLQAPPNPILATLLADGLHFAPAGYDVLYEALTSVIQRELPECTPKNMPWIYRDWKEVLGVAHRASAVAGTGVGATAQVQAPALTPRQAETTAVNEEQQQEQETFPHVAGAETETAAATVPPPPAEDKGAREEAAEETQTKVEDEPVILDVTTVEVHPQDRNRDGDAADAC